VDGQARQRAGATKEHHRGSKAATRHVSSSCRCCLVSIRLTWYACHQQLKNLLFDYELQAGVPAARLLLCRQQLTLRSYLCCLSC
jgi:hypothetical protein